MRTAISSSRARTWYRRRPDTTTTRTALRNGSSRWSLTDEGAEKFAAATKQAAIDQTSIYTYMDDEIISTATVGSEYASEGITGGQASISGNFDRESASALAGNINAGALQYNLNLEELRAAGSDAGRKVAGNQPESRRHRSAARRRVYDCLLPCAGRHGVHCAMCLYGTVYAHSGPYAGQPHAARYCGHHPVHRYGRGCERHYFRAHQRRAAQREKHEIRDQIRFPSCICRDPRLQCDNLYRRRRALRTLEAVQSKALLLRWGWA